ncbi:hypothetical protein Shyhy01_60790 [Streptomyces hygroscopicus subsp. hygroscopicus]|nr:hypothetical protein Shyhy01_60790 [Streptomyces hygroscopicus subsp. hygroscopicus]
MVYDVRPDPGADVRDAAALTRAPAEVDAVCHHAAMVGLGNGVADAPEYVSRNDLGTAVLVAAMARAGVERLLPAGSMVVYGEGRYTCPRHGAVRPGPRLAAHLEAGRFEPRCPACGAELSPGLVGEDAPADPRSVYAATKLAQEHLAAAWARSTGGTAICLRHHNVYAPRHPLCRRRRLPPLRARPRSGSPRLRGRPAAAGLRARPGRGGGERGRAGGGGRARRAHGVQHRQR